VKSDIVSLSHLKKLLGAFVGFAFKISRHYGHKQAAGIHKFIGTFDMIQKINEWGVHQNKFVCFHGVEFHEVSMIRGNVAGLFGQYLKQRPTPFNTICKHLDTIF